MVSTRCRKVFTAKALIAVLETSKFVAKFATVGSAIADRDCTTSSVKVAKRSVLVTSKRAGNSRVGAGGRFGAVGNAGTVRFEITETTTGALGITAALELTKVDGGDLFGCWSSFAAHAGVAVGETGVRVAELPTCLDTGRDRDGVGLVPVIEQCGCIVVGGKASEVGCWSCGLEGSFTDGSRGCVE